MSRPLRAALYNLTTTTQFGGVESFVWEIARCLAARGIEPVIIGGRGAVRRESPGVRVAQFPFLSRERLRRVPGWSKAYTLTKLVERLSLAQGALGYMRAERFDIVHVQKPYDLPAAIWLQRFGSKALLGCHGTDFFPGDRPLARRVDGSVSCSAFNAAQVEARYGLRPEVIYNGIDPAAFQPQEADPGLRRALAGEGALILNVGRLVRWKGVQHLIGAVEKLGRTREVSLAIVGAGEYRPALEELARADGLRERVHFVGYVPPGELARYYAACDVLGVASYANETFSIAALEAMTCARPVVGTRFGGIPEVVEEGETGLLARPEDPGDVADKLGELLDAPARRAEMGAKGRRRALDLFTWDKVADRLVRVYRAIV